MEIQEEYTIEWIKDNLSDIIDKLEDDIEVTIKNEKYLLNNEGVLRWIGLYFDIYPETGWTEVEDEDIIEEVKELVLEKHEIQKIFKKWILNNKQWN